MNRAIVVMLLTGCLGACAESRPVLEALPPVVGNAGVAAARVNGDIGSTERTPAPQIVYGQPLPLQLAPSGRTGQGGDVSLDFADTDIREVVAQILGTQLRLNYTIDPGVKGTATLHTATPVSQSQLLPILQTLLAQSGAALSQSDGLYRVTAVAAAAGGQGAAGPVTTASALAGSDAVSGSAVIPLRFAGADDLARVLQPFVANGARITPDASRNALLITGDPGVRATLVSLVQAFDIDILAGQSYALLPATAGDAKDFASALQDAFRAQGGGALAGQVRIVPMARINAVLVVSSQPRYIDDARRVYALVDRNRRETIRSWHVYYLQNSHSNDAAYVLQQAFTPNSVTAQPTNAGQLAPGGGSQTTSSGGRGSSLGGGGISGGAGGGASGGPGAGSPSSGGGFPSMSGGSGAGQGGMGQGGAPLGGPGGGGGGQTGGATAGQPSAPSANPLLGGLDPSGGGGTDTNTIRIIPNPQNNAILVYSTQREQETVEAMLRKMDILPLQVRIDATIAEVTLNDELKYGTQFFFKSGGINGVLSAGPSGSILTGLTSAALGSTPLGFVIGGTGLGGAPLAISALQAVTTVNVLSSPEILVLDNQPARLQVGSLVPYLTSSSQSSLVANATIVNQVNYQPTGVIMQVTPRVNSGGLVTLDIYQEVSDVDNTTPKASGIDSPTFLERNVSSRIVIQDGQTIGLAGLIRDSSSRGNSGIPWLKDIPILGFLAGTQSNFHARTELLVLITPHVVHDQRDARALTEDLRDQLVNAAGVPFQAETVRTTGRTDPNRAVRRALRLER